MSRAAVIAAGAAVLVGLAYANKRAADALAAGQAEGDAPADGFTVLDYANPWGYIERSVEAHQTETAMHDRNIPAFLDMLSASEGTNSAGLDPYRVCYGYRHAIESFADHPAVTGEWRGEKLPDAMCAAAGRGPGCVSTAAGRYQLIKPTWLACKRALGLPDFSPDSQDRAAVYLIRQRGALDDVQAGRIADAIVKCRREWASLPGAGYGQGERTMTALLDAFTTAGGNLA